MRVLDMERGLRTVGYEHVRMCTGGGVAGACRCFITPASNMFHDVSLLIALDWCEVVMADICSLFGMGDSTDDDSSPP